MKRRTLLGRTAAAGAAFALAGCLRRGRDENVLQVASSNFEEGEDGYLVYTVTVSNPSERSASGTAYVNSQLNGEATTKVRQVSLDPHSTTTLRITYDVKYANVTNFEPSVDLREN
ncbi:MAG: hypothetical protein ABEJ88_01815 [Halobacterium sp.]